MTRTVWTIPEPRCCWRCLAAFTFIRLLWQMEFHISHSELSQKDSWFYLWLNFLETANRTLLVVIFCTKPIIPPCAQLTAEILLKTYSESHVIHCQLQSRPAVGLVNTFGRARLTPTDSNQFEKWSKKKSNRLSFRKLTKGKQNSWPFTFRI